MRRREVLITKFKETRFGAFLRKRRFLNAHNSERSFYRQFVSPGDLVFDVGANIGDKATLFRSLGARVICFEPQTKIVDFLKRRFQYDKDVVIESGALGESSGEGSILLCSQLSALSTMAESSLSKGRFAKELKGAMPQAVPIQTLEAMVKKYGKPDFCKIDVEGYEIQVIRGLMSSVPLLSLEVNIEFLPEIKQCVEILGGRGLASFNFSIGENNSLIFSKWLSSQEIIEFLESQTDPLFWGDIYARS